LTHPVDGFDLKFTSRRSWKAERREHGRLVDVVPVTWTKGRRVDAETKELFQEVWYQDPRKLAARAASRLQAIHGNLRGGADGKVPDRTQP